MPTGVYQRSDKEMARLRENLKNFGFIPPKGHKFSEATRFKKGDAPWNKGRSWPEMSGENHPSKNPLHREKYSRMLDKNRAVFYGSNHPQWKGGKTPLIQKIRNSTQYAAWRLKVFEHDKFTCCICGADRGGNLEAHHVEQFAAIFHDQNITTVEQAFACEKLWDARNGVTLCETCHPIGNEISRLVRKEFP